MMLAGPNDAVFELAAIVRHVGADELADRLESAVEAARADHPGPDPRLGLPRFGEASADFQRKDHMSILWIIIIVLVVLAVLGFFGRGRFSR